ncbi:hypothetical protein JCM11641_001343 [Rhodosporidiobolus odoratus]
MPHAHSAFLYSRERIKTDSKPLAKPPTSLPAELVLYIIDFASTSSRRSACTLALLCRATCRRMRTYLYTCPVLYLSAQISLFIRSVQRNKRLARSVKKVVLDGGGEGNKQTLTMRLSKIMESCVEVEELELRGLVIFSLTDFAGAENVRHMTLTSCLLSDRTSISRYHPLTTTLPSLESLSLHQVRFDSLTAPRFLSHGMLPRLAALELDGCRLQDQVNFADLGPYEPSGLAEQLELLHIHGESSDASDANALRRDLPSADPFDLVGKCTSLRSLSLPVTAVTSDLLDSLPVDNLTQVTLLPPQHAEEDTLEPHLAAVQALSEAILSLAINSSSTSPFYASTSPSHTPLLLSSSPSTPNVLSPFSSPMPSPPLEMTAPSPLSQMLRLTLPASWNVDSCGTWENGAFEWAIGRILRECGKREVEVRFLEETGHWRRIGNEGKLKEKLMEVRLRADRSG